MATTIPAFCIAIGTDNNLASLSLVGPSNALPVTAGAGTGTFTVGGVAAAGSPVSGSPVLVAGSDGTNVRTVKTGTGGAVVTDVTSQMALAGIAANNLSKFKKQGLVGTVTAIKASAGTLYGITVVGTDTANDMFIQLFDLATGSVTLGTTVADWQFMIPKWAAAGTSLAQQTLTLTFPQGIPFATAISIASTTTLDGAVGSAASKVDAYALYI